jgi:hypothetical protein
MENALHRLLSSREYVHHRDGDKQNDQLENLELINPTDHVKLHQPYLRVPRGPQPGRRKLDYEFIRRLMDEGLGYRRIARITGYSPSSVGEAISVIRVEGGVSH